MTIASEAASAPRQTAAALHGGLDSLSRNQSLTFTQYAKQTVSQDGFVYWAATATTLSAKGSLHYGTERDQAEDQTAGINSVIFASEVEITEFNDIGAGILWIASWQTPGGPTIKIAFDRRSAYYVEANLYHYTGFAVYPALESQLIASASDLPSGPIVSNSLPIWLGLPSALSAISSLVAETPVYPSFLVPENIVPPYIVAHIEPGTTKSLQIVPIYNGTPNGATMEPMTSDQLCQEPVKLTFYGFNNQQILQYIAALKEYSYGTDAFGFMKFPVPQDEKRAQPEIAAIAMKKTLVIDASYYQSTADAIARNLIVSAQLSFTLN